MKVSPSSRHLLHHRSCQPRLNARPLFQARFKGIAQRHQRINLRNDSVLLCEWGDFLLLANNELLP
jgi:hypothetical protein